MASKRIDGYLDPVPTIYGNYPLNPGTWDADRMYSCYGDTYGYSPVTGVSNISTYTGDRCDQRSCPYGYDVRLTDKLYVRDTIGNDTIIKEIQQIVCAATGGYFSLSFRGLISDFIYSNSTISDLYTILRKMSNIGEILLQLSGNINNPFGSFVCGSNNYNSVNVTFLSQYGLIPLMNITNYNLTGVNNDAYVQSISVSTGPPLLECVGRGTCDRTSGECKCWTNYATSDGFGDRGLHGDCGYNSID